MNPQDETPSDMIAMLCAWLLGTRGNPRRSTRRFALSAGQSSPGMSSPPTSDEESEYWPYVVVNNYFADKSGSPELRIEC